MGKHMHSCYYFHLPEAGAIEILTANGKEYLNCSYNANGNSVIEAGYSFIINESAGAAGTRRKKELHRARLYCITGYYDKYEYRHKEYIIKTCLDLVNNEGYKLC